MGVNGPLSSDEGETFNTENWELGIDGSERPYVVNSGDTLTSASAASEGWHHLALVRERYGTTRLCWMPKRWRRLPRRPSAS